jgi:ActR/RegA family two-component response regulator
MDESRKILLAGEDESFCVETAKSLRSVGYACDCMCDVAGVANMLASPLYDLLILDVGGSNGADARLVHEVREVANTLPIILATDCPCVETAMTAINLSVVAYLVKPIPFDYLLRYVQRSVVRSQLHRAIADMRTRSKLWDDTVAGLLEILQEPLAGEFMELAGPLLTTSFEGVVASVADLRRVLECVVENNRNVPRSEAMAMWHKLDLTRTALSETIAVLEETKHAFKSKRLGELRQQLQGLLGVLERD